MKKELTQDEFYVPAETVSAEIKVKGSRFTATILRVQTTAEAEASYQALKKKYHNATHNCFAYRIDDTHFRYSDDGEPSGTAGKPILQAIDGVHIRQILCTVTRYFGGTKLGTGGLIRAYSDAAISALECMSRKVIITTRAYDLRFSYDLEPLIRNLIEKFEGHILENTYDKEVRFKVALPDSLKDSFCDQLIKTTHASVKILAL